MVNNLFYRLSLYTVQKKKRNNKTHLFIPLPFLMPYSGFPSRIKFKPLCGPQTCRYLLLPVDTASYFRFYFLSTSHSSPQHCICFSLCLKYHLFLSTPCFFSRGVGEENKPKKTKQIYYMYLLWLSFHHSNIMLSFGTIKSFSFSKQVHNLYQ